MIDLSTMANGGLEAHITSGEMRPLFLVLDPPSPETLSTRKMVIESAKFNVVTAFTPEEGLEITAKVPVTAIIFHTSVANGTPRSLVRDFKEIRDVPVIALSPDGRDNTNADHALSSHEPLALVLLLQQLFGDPAKVDQELQKQLSKRRKTG